MSDRCSVAIVGAGPTGLAAAWRLRELGCTDWLLIEREAEPGGLASSVVDDAGFVWDLGGHVLFSHYAYFDRLMERALGTAWVEHMRESWVWIRDRWVPYPFQNNIWRLPEADAWACLSGLMNVWKQAEHTRARPTNFQEWLLQSFGPGLCETFMFPYNRKVWAYDPAQLNVAWMGERVATVELPRIVENLVYRRDDVGWGPNATFKFPLEGGTGAIWKALFKQLPRECCELGDEVVSIDGRTRVLKLRSGRTIRYERLISTMPRDVLLQQLDGEPELARQASHFVWSSSHIIGVGIGGQPPDTLRTKCWMYFPEASTEFYRVTVFSNYSPHNVPRPGEQWSLMAEVSESPQKPVNSRTVVAETVAGLERVGLLDDPRRIVSTWHRRLTRGYPTPWLGRDAVLDGVEPRLRELGIWSRGRFGLWRYEVGNQDHSAMQGVWAAEAALGLTTRTPGVPFVP
jgi:protoporphyrinogen oxidase